MLIGLILAVPGLRGAWLVPPAPAPADPQPAVVQPQPAAEETELEVPEPPQPSLEPSEPGLEVLPPLAAQTPGRRVPKQLLVGRRAGMFASVEDAVAVAIPGDVIEIRTNQPMLVGGAELRVKEKGENAPLTIRAGKGYQPILRVGAETSFLWVTNVDLTLEGIHFVTSVSSTYFHPEIAAWNSNVMVKSCSFTTSPGSTARFGIRVWNPKGIDHPLRVSLHHCLMRGYSDGSAVLMRDPAISVSFDESAIVGGSAIYCDPVAEKQSISFRRCTLLGGTYSIHVSVGGKELANPLSLQMERSLYTDVGPYDTPFAFGYDGLCDTVEKRDAVLRARFREFKANDNVVRFRAKGWPNEYPALVGGAMRQNEAAVGVISQQDETLRLGKKVEDIRDLLKQKGAADAWAFLATLLPQDLTPSSTGLLAQRMSQGIRYGADLNKLPVPPAATLTPYHAHDLAIADPGNLKVRLKSEPFPLGPYWGADARQLLGKPTKPGQWADVLIPVSQAGKWCVRARLTQSPASGIVQFTLNGEPAGKEVDLFAAETAPLTAVELGEHTLPKGEVNLRIETVGRSPNAPKPGFQFGIERVVLRRVGKK